MKQTLIFSLGLFILCACNQQEKDPVEKADSANKEKTDNDTPAAARIDDASADFLVKAADGGMTEVEASRTAQQKATNGDVKSFAQMMVDDHTGANAAVKQLAANLNVTIPAAPSEEHQKDITKLNEKTGRDFDKAYMNMMVDDHKKTIDLFEKAENDCKEESVKAFVRNTLPKLRTHLNAADSIQNRLKK